MRIIHEAAYPALTALLILAVNGYVVSHPLYISKTRAVDEQLASLDGRAEESAKHPLTLFVGNSYVRTGVRPPAEDVYAQFILNGLPLSDVVHILRSLPEGLQVDTVAVGLGYNYATPARSFSYVYRKYEATNPVAEAWWTIPVARSYSLSSTMVKNDLICLAQRKPCRGNDGEIPTFERRADDSDAHAERIEAEVGRRLREYLPFTSKVSPLFEGDLLAIRAECDRLGADMMTFTMPIYRPLRVALDPSVLERFRETAASVSPYIDLNQRYPNWKPAYFADPTHLAQDGQGAQVATAELLRFISGEGG